MKRNLKLLSCFLVSAIMIGAMLSGIAFATENEDDIEHVCVYSCETGELKSCESMTSLLKTGVKMASLHKLLLMKFHVLPFLRKMAPLGLSKTIRTMELTLKIY